MKLISDKPYKQYVTDIKNESQVKEICKFLRANKDKEISIKVNGKSIKLNSLASQKKYAAGFEMGCNIMAEQSKRLFKQHQATIKGLKSSLSGSEKKAIQAEEDRVQMRERLRVSKAILDLRIAAWKDKVAELEQDREILLAELKGKE